MVLLSLPIKSTGVSSELSLSMLTSSPPCLQLDIIDCVAIDNYFLLQCPIPPVFQTFFHVKELRVIVLAIKSHFLHPGTVDSEVSDIRKSKHMIGVF